MRPSLAQVVIAAHRRGAPRAGDRLPAPGEEVAVAPDQVLLEEEAARLALHAVETLGLARVAVPHVFVVLERDGVRAGEDVRREQRHIEAAADRLGITLARPGFGEAGAAHRARAAIPGRLAAGALGRFAGAGAFGTLLEPADPLALAGVLAGELLRVRVPHAHAVRVVGRLPAWSSGFDLAVSLLRSLPALAAGADVIEFVGADLPRLPVSERLACADVLAARSWRALFPSDEATREALALDGRANDWRELAPADDGESAAIVDAGVVEPQLWVAGEPAPVEARARSGSALEGVWLGPRCGVEDVMRCLDRMDGARRAEHVALVLSPGSRRLLDTLAAGGVIARLEAAGVEVRAVGVGDEPPARGGAWLVCGGAGGWAWCGPEVAAASARLGVVADPRELDEIGARAAVHAAAAPAAPLVRAAEDGRLLRSGAAQDAAFEAGEGLPVGTPLDRPLRGVVLADVERVQPEGWIRWGPRVSADRDRPSSLARHVLAVEAPGLAGAAAAQGGGFVRVRGPVPETSRGLEEAIALKALGVHAVLAPGYAAAARRALAMLGVLALEWPADAPEGPETGHELEIPDLPDGLAPRKPLVCRDLTRGRQLTLRHAHEPAEIEDLVAGGRLARISMRLSSPAPGGPPTEEAWPTASR